MRRGVRFTVIGTMLAALAVPPAHARGASASVAAAPKAVPARPAPLGGSLYIYNIYPATEEVGSEAPAPPPPPARPRPAAKLPLCHEVTAVGVVVERSSACSPTPR